MDFTYDVAKYVVNTNYSDIPEEAIKATKQDIYDSLATAIAGSSAPGIAQILELCSEWGGTKQASSFVFNKKLPAHNAAFVNAAMIHAYDYDDTHDVAMMHCGCIIVSTALAIAEMLGTVSGEEFLAAVTIGLDIHCRLGIATTVGIVTSGYVYTPLMGIFAGVCTAGKLMKLTEDKLINALGIAYSQAAGTYQAITDSAWTKKLQPGLAARNAIVACELAQKGFIGSKNNFEGVFGFYHVYLNDNYDLEVLRKDLGTYFTGKDLSFKPWPCGRPSQPPINAAIEAYEKFHIDPADIEDVEIQVNEHLVKSSCLPVETRNYPKTVVDAQFSIPYGVACGLVNGKYGLSDYTDEGLKRPDVLDICAKVRGTVKPEYEEKYHAKVCPVDLIITTNDGKKYEHHMDYTLGCAEKPMTEKHFAEKMESCIACCAKEMPADTAATLKVLIDHMETLPSTDAIIRAMMAQ